ncbi:hypothetical protein AMIS_74490 [Actinoplanes missouriensis 431]|uniref:PE domain-containing protein n=1 Tax=Actinoplanes missouriensis (strain ATCC 14538 / DSM 43046 / CBS 188.64 / JCM 3121 / NBRC 102363 / NCIMB 12654 / NRRL B-3342 / UNCC 431) TaxID=512565 RepID=I0HI32_ACTM4|nr:hypothetical protein [Actinoplanes missouriensis]BAL92669.1 hypothetical protein AMIS_74490 [Actinoplanes missouriensis 431]
MTLSWPGDACHIEADLLAMEEVAARLAGAVERDYAPEAVTVSSTMLTRLPAADRTFSELGLFVHAHERAQEATLQNVYHYANGTYGLADAVRETKSRYAASDAAVEAGLLRHAP